MSRPDFLEPTLTAGLGRHSQAAGFVRRMIAEGKAKSLTGVKHPSDDLKARTKKKPAVTRAMNVADILGVVKEFTGTKKQRFEAAQEEIDDLNTEIRNLEEMYGQTSYYETMEERRQIRYVEGIPEKQKKEIDALRNKQISLLRLQTSLVSSHVKETYGDRKITKKDITDLGNSKWDKEIKERLEGIQRRQRSTTMREAQEKRGEEDWTKLTLQQLKTLIVEHEATKGREVRVPTTWSKKNAVDYILQKGIREAPKEEKKELATEEDWTKKTKTSLKTMVKDYYDSRKERVSYPFGNDRGDYLAVVYDKYPLPSSVDDETRLLYETFFHNRINYKNNKIPYNVKEQKLEELMKASPSELRAMLNKGEDTTEERKKFEARKKEKTLSK